MNEDFLAELGALALGNRLKRLADRLIQDSSQVYRSDSAGFEPRWFPVFMYLYRRGPTSITGLARALGVSHPGINKVANELIEAKLAAPYRDRSDKRKRVLALTSIGREKYQQLEPVWRDIRQAVQSMIDEGPGQLLPALADLEQRLGESSLISRHALRQGGSHQVGIRPYEPAYKEAFRTLNEAWIKHYFVLEAADSRVLNDPEAAILADGGEILLAVDEQGQVIGTCALIRVDAVTGELTKMAVAEAAKGKLVGQKIAEAIIKLARERGYRMLRLESNRRLNAAISLYRKLGFEEKPFPQPSAYSRADIYMELNLAAAENSG